jgi:hypothetical protein
MAIQVAFVAVGLFVPMLGTMTSDYFLSTTGDALVKKQTDLAFWGIWGALYGIVVAATGAATC